MIWAMIGFGILTFYFGYYVGKERGMLTIHTMLEISADGKKVTIKDGTDLP